MKKFLLIALIAIPTFAMAQTPVSITEFVKIKDGKKAEAVYYYENNWKHLRDLALERGIISDFKFVINKTEDKAEFDFVLYTEYKDREQFNTSEDKFTKLIEEVLPDGPKLLNDIKPGDFRENLFYIEGETIFSSSKK